MAKTKKTGQPSIAELWDRIEAWFAQRPQFDLQLRPGVKKDLERGKAKVENQG